MFLLPSLPFGSASGGKTQPLLHPSPADRDEQGGLMQSSWPALPAPAGTAHSTTNTAELLRRCGRQLPAPCGGSAGPAGTGRGERGAAPAPAPCPDTRPLCLHPLGPTPPVLPEDGHPLGFAASSLAHCRRGWGLARGPPGLAFAMAKPPQATAVCLP